MAKKIALDTKYNKVRGIYTDELRSGTNWYIRLDIHGQDKFINVTKQYGVKNITEAKKKQIELLSQKESMVTDNSFVNNYIEDYISKRPSNPRYPSRGQDYITQKRYELYIKDTLTYVKLSNLSKSHIMRIKKILDDRKVGKDTFQKVKTLITSALKNTEIDLHKLFKGFEANSKNTENNKRKVPIDKIINGDLEDTLQTLYNIFNNSLQEAIKTNNTKEIDKYSALLFLLLTARRSGETAYYKVSDIEVIDKKKDIYKINIKAEYNKENYAGEVFIPKVIIPFIKERLKNAKAGDFIFESDISTLHYTTKKISSKLNLKQNKSLNLHLFRSLFRNIMTDREEPQKPIDYIMGRKDNRTTDAKYYDGELTEMQRRLVYKTLRKYENIANGKEPKLTLNYDDF